MVNRTPAKATPSPRPALRPLLCPGARKESTKGSPSRAAKLPLVQYDEEKPGQPPSIARNLNWNFLR